MSPTKLVRQPERCLNSAKVFSDPRDVLVDTPCSKSKKELYNEGHPDQERQILRNFLARAPTPNRTCGEQRVTFKHGNLFNGICVEISELLSLPEQVILAPWG